MVKRDIIQEVEHYILDGYVLNRAGHWVTISDMLAEEKEVMSHLSRGEVWTHGRWVVMGDGQSQLDSENKSHSENQNKGDGESQGLSENQDQSESESKSLNGNKTVVMQSFPEFEQKSQIAPPPKTAVMSLDLMDTALIEDAGTVNTTDQTVNNDQKTSVIDAEIHQSQLAEITTRPTDKIAAVTTTDTHNRIEAIQSDVQSTLNPPANAPMSDMAAEWESSQKNLKKMVFIGCAALAAGIIAVLVVVLR